MDKDREKFHVLDHVPDLIVCIPAIVIAVLLILRGGIH